MNRSATLATLGCVLSLFLSAGAVAQPDSQTRQQAAGTVRQALAAGPMVPGAQGYPPDPLTRAQVLADLDVWKRAGMADFYRGNQEPDVYSAKYRKRYAEYVRMRNGPEYQAALQRAQEQRD